MSAMAQDVAFITCPHLVEDADNKEKPRFCGLDSKGHGRRTRVAVPFWAFGTDDFIMKCPTCSNDILVLSRHLVDPEEEVAS